MSEPLRFAVIGCGAIASAIHLPNLATSPLAVLQVCCDTDEGNLARAQDHRPVAISRDWQATVRDPSVDAVLLATTEQLRLPVIALCASLGKPIYVEKPVAPTLEELREIQRVVHAAAIPFCAGHNRRSSPAMLEAHRLFRAHMTKPARNRWRWEREARRPALPEDGVAAMQVRINDDWHSWKGWVFDPTQSQYGPMLFEMTHFTDLCNWLLAAEPESVSAQSAGMLAHSVSIRYRSGELATIFMTGNGSFGYPKELYELFGNGGALVVDHMLEIRSAGIGGTPHHRPFPMLNDRHPAVGREGGLSGWLAKKRTACEDAEDSGDPLKQFTAEPDKGHAAALSRFIAEIRGTGPMVCGIDDAVLATRVAFAAIRAAELGRTVALDEI